MLEGECRIWNLGVQVWRGDEAEKKKKKKNVFLEESNNFRGRGWQVGRLGRGNSSKKKKLYAGLLHDSEGALWDSRC